MKRVGMPGAYYDKAKKRHFCQLKMPPDLQAAHGTKPFSHKFKQGLSKVEADVLSIPFYAEWNIQIDAWRRETQPDLPRSPWHELERFDPQTGQTESIFFLPREAPPGMVAEPPAPIVSAAPVPVVIGNPITAAQAIKNWADRNPGCKDDAVRHRRNMLGHMLVWVSRGRGLSATLDDLTEISQEEGQAWVQAMQITWPAPSNVPRDRLDSVKGVYTQAKRGLLGRRVNPFDSVYAPPEYPAQSKRCATSEADAKTVLLAARASGNDDLRWLVELEMFQGASGSEIADMRLKDVVLKGDIPCINITNQGRLFLREDGITTYMPELKADQRERLQPLHPAIRDGGFLAFVEARRREFGPNAALFETIKPDIYRRRNARASDMTSKLWRDAKIEPKKLDPETGKMLLNDTYSLRHRFISRLIATRAISGSAAEQRRYLAGHAGALPGDVIEAVGGPHETNYGHYEPPELLPIISAIPDPTERAASARSS